MLRLVAIRKMQPFRAASHSDRGVEVGHTGVAIRPSAIGAQGMARAREFRTSPERGANVRRVRCYASEAPPRAINEPSTRPVTAPMAMACQGLAWT